MLSFMEAMQFRHACKQFDPTRRIPPAEFRQILEFARLSPSSFGMEPWRFVVVQDPALRQRLREQCWNQPQITDSSHVVVILAKIQAVKPDSDYVRRIIHRRGLPTEAEEAAWQRYVNHHHKEVWPVMSTFAWASKQCYIALANMMTGAASLGIDSCPIEGFSKAGVEEVLDIDRQQYGVAVVVAFGYRAGAQSKRLRQTLDELVEWR